MCQSERSKSDLHVHCKSTFCSVAVAVAFSLARLFSIALSTFPSLEDVKVAAMKVIEVFVVLSNVHASFSGLSTCQVPVVHGRYDATRL